MLIPKIVKTLLPKNLRRHFPQKINVISVSTHESRRLNHVYRKRNKPANVLSFRYGPDYGEIVLCPAVIRREAKASGNSYRYQLQWMIIHGLIHLSGIHHEQSKRAYKKFEQIEQKTLKKLRN